MKIINQTKNIILADNAIVADTPLKRLRGLLGKKELHQGEALVLKPCNSVHTFFMRFPIDVLFLDKNNRVVEAVSSLGPFRLTPIYFRASSVIELPAGAIQSVSLQKGDLLSLE